MQLLSTLKPGDRFTYTTWKKGQVVPTYRILVNAGVPHQKGVRVPGPRVFIKNELTGSVYRRPVNRMVIKLS